MVWTEKARETLSITHEGREWGKDQDVRRLRAQRRVESGTDGMLHRDECPWVRERPRLKMAFCTEMSALGSGRDPGSIITP